MMPTARLTKRSVDLVEPSSKDIFLWDDEIRGFGLRVTPKGSRSYILQYRMGGREARTCRYTIGGHGSPWTPDLARKEAQRLLVMVRQGTDPVQANKERRRQAVELAFDLYVDSFIDLYLKKRWKQWKLGAGVLRREAVPVLRSKALPRIVRSDLNPIWDALQNRPAVARLTHATLRKLFRWAVSRGDVDRSPLEGVEAPPPVPSRERVLSDEELSLVWRGSDELGRPFAQFIKLLILTGQRREEVASISWDELDQQEASWTIPSTRTKNRNPNLVPLSPAALEIVSELAGAKEWPKRGYLLTTTGRTPVSGFTKPKRRLDDLMATELGDRFDHWRLHDLRRTLATGLQRLGVRFEVTEAVLNHVSGSRGSIAGVYQRYNWAAEKKAALDAWANHVLTTSKRNGSSV
jgi:integrase